MKIRYNSIGFLSVVALLAIGFATGSAHATTIDLLNTGNSNPNGNGAYQNGGALAGGGSVLPFFLTNDTPFVLQLDHGSMGVTAFTPFGLRTTGVYAQAWTPAGFMSGNPLNPGNLVAHVPVAPPVITTVGNGSILGLPTTNYIASWNSPGALLGLNFILNPGESAYFTMGVDGQSNSNGHWLSRESTLSNPSDTLWVVSSGYQPFANIAWTQYDGRLEGTWSFTVVPDPASGALLLLGGLIVSRRRRQF